MVRVVLPQHLRTLAGVGREVALEVSAPVTQASILDLYDPDRARAVTNVPAGTQSFVLHMRDLDVARNLSNQSAYVDLRSNAGFVSLAMDYDGRFITDFLDTLGIGSYATTTAFFRLRKTVDELQQSNLSLETTKEALVKSEKLASMGQLAAGIAHEVNNPLGILLLHANLLLEDCEDDSDVSADVKLIVDQANRCKKIISGLLNFARQSRVVRQPGKLAEH